MDVSRLSVTVVGSGIGGAAAALFLARAGANVALLEKATDLRAVGAGIALAENGLAVLQSLGLAEALETVAVDVGPARIVNAEGRVLLDPSDPKPRILMIRRSTLQGLLLGAVDAEERIERQSGTEVISADPSGMLTIRSEHGEIKHASDLILGADGVHSRVRSSTGFGADVSRPGISYIRGLVPPGLARNEEAWTSAGLFGSFPVDGGTYFYASVGSRKCQEAVGRQDLAALRVAWTHAYPAAEPILAALGSWDDLLLNAVIRVSCTSWHKGRIVLLGDAAHAMAPNLGQGGNSALVDASILAHCLVNEKRLEDGLSRYTGRRRPAVTRVADVSARLGSLAEWIHPAARFLRDRVLMPVAARLQSGKTLATVLQEDPVLLAGLHDKGSVRETVEPAG
jgi:2-polyprenyl-6-methoxyphenol hydroxylase-like FAD-dependent oxidoreductase